MIFLRLMSAYRTRPKVVLMLVSVWSAISLKLNPSKNLSLITSCWFSGRNTSILVKSCCICSLMSFSSIFSSFPEIRSKNRKFVVIIRSFWNFNMFWFDTVMIDNEVVGDSFCPENEFPLLRCIALLSAWQWFSWRCPERYRLPDLHPSIYKKWRKRDLFDAAFIRIERVFSLPLRYWKSTSYLYVFS